jgi:hypothetical protein
MEYLVVCVIAAGTIIGAVCGEALALCDLYRFIKTEFCLEYFSDFVMDGVLPALFGWVLGGFLGAFATTIVAGVLVMAGFVTLTTLRILIFLL